MRSSAGSVPDCDYFSMEDDLFSVPITRGAWSDDDADYHTPEEEDIIGAPIFNEGWSGGGAGYIHVRVDDELVDSPIPREALSDEGVGNYHDLEKDELFSAPIFSEAWGGDGVADCVIVTEEEIFSAPIPSRAMSVDCVDSAGDSFPVALQACGYDSTTEIDVESLVNLNPELAPPSEVGAQSTPQSQQVVIPITDLVDSPPTSRQVVNSIINIVDSPNRVETCPSGGRNQFGKVYNRRPRNQRRFSKQTSLLGNAGTPMCPSTKSRRQGLENFVTSPKMPRRTPARHTRPVNRITSSSDQQHRRRNQGPGATNFEHPFEIPEKTIVHYSVLRHPFHDSKVPLVYNSANRAYRSQRPVILACSPSRPLTAPAQFVPKSTAVTPTKPMDPAPVHGRLLHSVGTIQEEKQQLQLPIEILNMESRVPDVMILNPELGHRHESPAALSPDLKDHPLPELCFDFPGSGWGDSRPEADINFLLSGEDDDAMTDSPIVLPEPLTSARKQFQGGEIVVVQASEKAKTFRNPRLRWNPELHAKFLIAVESVGGIEKATPKVVVDAMKCPDINIDHIKSHLQKFRMQVDAAKRRVPPPKRKEKVTPDQTDEMVQKEIHDSLNSTIEKIRNLSREIGEQNDQMREMLKIHQRGQIESENEATTSEANITKM